MVSRYLFLTLSLFFVLSHSALGAVTATVDRNAVGMGETFELTISIDTANPGSRPNITPLKNDFDILDVQQGPRIESYNGQTSQRYLWTLTLTPRNMGVLTIPPFTIDGQKTPPVKISVSKPTEEPGLDSSSPIALELIPSQTEGYIQSQFIVTLRLIFQVNLSRLDDLTLDLSDAIYQPLGNSKRYSKIVDGKRVGIIEKRFALFPQRSGTLTIKRQSITASIEVPSRISPFFSDAKRVSATSKPVSLTVHPQPPNFPGKTWLPAQSITINEDWSNDAFMVDEPVTRTITIDAAGLTGEQLPQLSAEPHDSLKTYPEKPEVSTQTTQQTVMGTAVHKSAIIPTKAGIITLPEVSVPWWNTQTNQLEYATLPAKKITVKPNPNARKQQTAPDMPAGEPASNNSLPPRIIEKEVKIYSPGVWPWLFAAVSVLWLGTMAILIVVWRRKKPLSAETVTADKKPENRTPVSISDIKTACRNNDAALTRELLLNYFRHQKTPAQISTLDDIGKLGDHDLAQAINELNCFLYADKISDWNGADFWKVIQKYLSQKDGDKPSNSRLSSLNPD